VGPPPDVYLCVQTVYLNAIWPDFWGCVFEAWPAHPSLEWPMRRFIDAIWSSKMEVMLSSFSLSPLWVPHIINASRG
jgi:hypothetical protein